VVLLAYGMNESFEGEAGLANFEKGLGRLLDDVAATKARIILLGPNYHEDLGRPLPDPAAHNAQLKLYCEAIQKVAAARKLPYVDLFDSLAKVRTPNRPLTDNGIHLNDDGYKLAAREIGMQLRLGIMPWKPALAVGGAVSADARASEVQLEPQGGKFVVKDLFLPVPGALRELTIAGLAPGTYALSIDGQVVAKATAAEWTKGVALTTGPEFDQIEKIRQAVIAKNSLFFYRWRPQNWTYLFGFRKHEQGQNAKEIPEFDPLIEAKEAEIAKLRVPVPHTYEIKPVK
jgi:hypothetical protein